MQATLSIIKPDAVSKNVIGKIIDRFEKEGLKIIASKMIILDKNKASGFYLEHEGKPFYEKLVNYMASGPVIVQVIYGENAVFRNRELMGNTDPSKASAGTIRADFADSIDANAVHGSDSEESAKREISYFFSDKELFLR